MFNTKNLKYHSLSCEWARKCTVNCIKIDHTQAIQRGGIPCKVCGGLEMSSNYKNLNDAYAQNKELAEIERLKAEMAKMMAGDLERMKTASLIFDSDYQTLHSE